MIIAERAGVHVWRLAHDVDWLSDEAASLLLHQMMPTRAPGRTAKSFAGSRRTRKRWAVLIRGSGRSA
jgi:hypothetical protein